MDLFEKKKTDWDNQAKLSSDFKAQVGRPFSEAQWQALACDVVNKLSLTENHRLLDVGCGSGLLLSHLSPFCKTIHGVDYSDEMVRKAKILLPQGSFHQSEASKLDFENGQFDRVLSYSIFHYFPSYEYALQTIKELIRVTEKDGIVLVGDLLDASFEEEIKSRSDLKYEQTIPHIHRYSEWRFYDLVKLVEDLEPLVQSVKIIAQPTDFALSSYRKDLIICR